MSLALRLKSTRKKLGLSQSQLADQVDVSQPTIANWERGGHIPRPDALARIASALGTDPAWLVSGELPAGSNPAHQHLARPIRHVPVYDWPVDMIDPRRQQACHYLTIASDQPNLFALKAKGMKDMADGSYLICSPEGGDGPGTYLLRSKTGFTIEERRSVSDDVFARLVYAIMSYE